MQSAHKSELNSPNVVSQILVSHGATATGFLHHGLW